MLLDSTTSTEDPLAHPNPSRTDAPPARYMPGPRPQCGFWYPTVDQSLVPWLAYEQGKIPFQALRGYWYLHEMKMQRCDIPPGTRVHYPLSNLAQGIETGPRQALQVRDALREVGLALWTDEDIQLPTQLNTLPWLDRHRYDAMRAHVDRDLRKFPLHRSIGKYVVRKDRPGLLATTFGVALRCLRYNGKTKALRYAGAVSADWIAGLWDISERTAYRHIETLEALCFLTTERKQPQWHKEAFGPWRVVARDWKPPKPSPPVRATALRVESAGDASTAEATAALAPDPTDPLEDGCTNLSSQACTDLAVVQDANHNKDMDLCTTTTPQPLRGKDTYHSERAPDVLAAPAVQPTTASPTSSPAAPGVRSDEERQTEESTRPPETWDTLEARYASLPADRQSALRADAVTRLVQQGHQRDFLIEPVILHEICCLLAVQEGAAVPVAPAASADVAPPPLPVPARPTLTPALEPPLEPDTLCQPAVDIPRGGQAQRKPPLATRHFSRETLQDTGQLVDIFNDGVEEGLWTNSEPNKLSVVRLAEHALATAKDPQNPGAQFAENLRHQRWYGSEADDDAAQRRIKRHGGIDPQQRAQPPPTSEPPPLSKDAWGAHELQRELARQGVHVDVFEQLHRADPAYWTDEHCHTIARELAHSQHAWKQGIALLRLGELGMEDGQALPCPEAVELCPECGENVWACLCADAAEP